MEVSPWCAKCRVAGWNERKLTIATLPVQRQKAQPPSEVVVH